ncbi:hypothetical protein GCM10027348_31860 [Hymenobacter tenuis]
MPAHGVEVTVEGAGLHGIEGGIGIGAVIRYPVVEVGPVLFLFLYSFGKGAEVVGGGWLSAAAGRG